MEEDEILMSCCFVDEGLKKRKISKKIPWGGGLHRGYMQIWPTTYKLKSNKK